MRFSVVIPCHNARRWISAALQSVQTQALPAFEVIVVDDNSTDGSADVVREAMPGAKVIHVKAGNAGASRNAGIEIATGDWVALLDADDQWYPNHLADAAELLTDSDAVAYCAGHDFMETDGTRLPLPRCYWQGSATPLRDQTPDDYVALMAKQLHFGHSTVCYRLDRLRAVGGFDLTQVRRHDIDLWLRMIRDHRWVYGPGPAASYRYRTPGSISRAEIEVAYYALRALVKNLDGYPQPIFRQLVCNYARRAMSVSFHDADPTWRPRLRELAWPYLPASYKLTYHLAQGCPRLFRALVNLKRLTYNATRRRLRQASGR